MSTAVYMRVSTEEQQDRGTIETQRIAAVEFCARKELAPVFYADDGVSGTLPFEERPEGRRLLADARAGLIKRVVVYRVDRIARDTTISLQTLEELDRLGVVLESIVEGLADLSTPHGKLQFSMLSSFASYERAMIVQRSIAGTNRLAREGVWLGGIVPYGYRVEGSRNTARLVVADEPLAGTDLTEADVVRLVYRMAGDEGRSTLGIAAHLNALAIPTAYTKDGRQVGGKGKRKQATANYWSPGRVRNLIVSTTYKGIHTWGKRAKKKRETIERIVPAIVSPEQWERAQQTLERNRRFSPRNARRKYLLRGMMKCDLCGLTYIGTANRGPAGQMVRYYKCNGKHAPGNMLPPGPRCVSKSLNAEQIETAIWSDVERFLRNPGEVLERLREHLQLGRSRVAELQTEADQLERVLTGKKEERNRVLTAFRRGAMNADDLDRQLAEVSREEDAVRQQVQALRARIHTTEGDSAQLASAESLLMELNNRLDGELSWEAKRQAIETLVAWIRITNADVDGETVVRLVARYRFAAVETCTGTGSWPRPA